MGLLLLTCFECRFLLFNALLLGNLFEEFLLRAMGLKKVIKTGCSYSIRKEIEF